MAKGYWVSVYRTISDPEKLAAYNKLAGPAVKAAGGRTFVRGGRVAAYETGIAERTVLIEFDSFEQAVAASVRARSTRPSIPRLSAAPSPSCTRRRPSATPDR